MLLLTKNHNQWMHKFQEKGKIVEGDGGQFVE